MRFLKYFSILCIIGITIYYWNNPPSSFYTIQGQTMGTHYSVKINTMRENNLLNIKVKEELELINKKMSVFDAESEISKINQADAGVWIPLSDEMSELFKASKKIYDLSNGYFDPTMGKLVDLWGFGASQQKKQPSEEKIKEVLKYSGMDKLEFTQDFKEIRKKNASVYINLSAIAKGYGVDKIYDLLKRNKYTDFVVEIGGEVRAMGKRSHEAIGWNIGVVDPKSKENAYVMSLKDSSVATSGDYRNYYEIDGKKLSHTISPRTGHPVEHNLASVTVFRAKCSDADALATAIMAMGEKKGMEFVNNNNIAAILFVRDDFDNMDSMASTEAQKLLKKNNAKN